MTPITWALVCAAAAAALFGVLFWIFWWGANVVFHPPNMSPMDHYPEQFGLEHEKASFETPDGVTLKGWMIPAKTPTVKTILLCHGWGDNKGDLIRRFHFLAGDFNLFLFDSRAHGESGGLFSTIGFLEAVDFDAALAFLKRTKPEWTKHLGLCGLSMGAAMGIRGMAEHPGFRCAVLESPFQSFNDVVAQFTWNGYRLPYYPAAWLTLLMIRWRLGADPEPYSPVYHMDRLPSIPLFFIAGGKDDLMPLPIVEGLYAMASSPKSIWVVPEATHGHCQEVAGPEYDKRILSFYRDNLD